MPLASVYPARLSRSVAHLCGVVYLLLLVFALQPAGAAFDPPLRLARDTARQIRTTLEKGKASAIDRHSGISRSYIRERLPDGSTVVREVARRGEHTLVERTFPIGRDGRLSGPVEVVRGVDRQRLDKTHNFLRHLDAALADLSLHPGAIVHDPRGVMLYPEHGRG